MCGDPPIEARAQAALPGDPLRERWHAFNLLRESDYRAIAQTELLSVCEAVAAETAAANAAVAAAATAAAAEAAAASKAAAANEAAAKAAAAANERRALDVRTPSKEPDLLEESGGGARLMDGEGSYKPCTPPTAGTPRSAPRRCATSSGYATTSTRSRTKTSSSGKTRTKPPSLAL